MNQTEKLIASIVIGTISFMFILLIWDTKFQHDCALNPSCNKFKVSMR